MLIMQRKVGLGTEALSSLDAVIVTNVGYLTTIPIITFEFSNSTGSSVYYTTPIQIGASLALKSSTSSYPSGTVVALSGPYPDLLRINADGNIFTFDISVINLTQPGPGPDDVNDIETGISWEIRYANQI